MLPCRTGIFQALVRKLISVQQASMACMSAVWSLCGGICLDGCDQVFIFEAHNALHKAACRPDRFAASSDPAGFAKALAPRAARLPHRQAGSPARCQPEPPLDGAVPVRLCCLCQRRLCSTKTRALTGAARLPVPEPAGHCKDPGRVRLGGP